VLTPKNAEPPRYTSTFDATRLLRDARKKLQRSPAAYVAILLALGAGLTAAGGFAGAFAASGFFTFLKGLFAIVCLIQFLNFKFGNPASYQ
jgi:fatty acid desaturase